MHLIFTNNLINEDMFELFGDVTVVLLTSSFGFNINDFILGSEIFTEDVVSDALAWLEIGTTDNGTVISV